MGTRNLKFSRWKKATEVIFFISIPLAWWGWKRQVQETGGKLWKGSQSDRGLSSLNVYLTRRPTAFMATVTVSTDDLQNLFFSCHLCDSAFIIHSFCVINGKLPVMASLISKDIAQNMSRCYHLSRLWEMFYFHSFLCYTNHFCFFLSFPHSLSHFSFTVLISVCVSSKIISISELLAILFFLI